MSEAEQEAQPEEPTAPEDSAEEAPPPKRPVLRFFTFALYLPLIGALGYLVILCLFLLFHGKGAGLFGILYGTFAFSFGRRMFGIYNGTVEIRVLRDVVLMVVVNLMLGVLLLSFMAQ